MSSQNASSVCFFGIKFFWYNCLFLLKCGKNRQSSKVYVATKCGKLAFLLALTKVKQVHRLKGIT